MDNCALYEQGEVLRIVQPALASWCFRGTTLGAKASRVALGGSEGGSKEFLAKFPPVLLASFTACYMCSFEVQEAIYIVPFKMRDGKSIGGSPKHAWRNELQPEIRG